MEQDAAPEVRPNTLPIKIVSGIAGGLAGLAMFIFFPLILLVGFFMLLTGSGALP